MEWISCDRADLSATEDVHPILSAHDPAVKKVKKFISLLLCMIGCVEVEGEGMFYCFVCSQLQDKPYSPFPGWDFAERKCGSFSPFLSASGSHLERSQGTCSLRSVGGWAEITSSSILKFTVASDLLLLSLSSHG